MLRQVNTFGKQFLNMARVVSGFDLAPLVNGIHNEQMGKKVLRNDFSILSTVGQLYNSSCQSTPDR